MGWWEVGELRWQILKVAHCISSFIQRNFPVETEQNKNWSSTHLTQPFFGDLLIPFLHEFYFTRLLLFLGQHLCSKKLLEIPWTTLTSSLIPLNSSPDTFFPICLPLNRNRQRILSGELKNSPGKFLFNCVGIHSIMKFSLTKFELWIYI